jgi:2-polyprenyl-3-methyl-5-hydroxy-6-metoxy-1,4-benzoquinol methylase
MKTNEKLYDSLYKKTKQKGLNGWGGEERLFLGELQFQNITQNNATPKSGKVLEIGCGEGNLSRIFSKNGYSVTGVDISEVAINWAKEKIKNSDLEIEYFQSDFSSKGLSINDSFDIIIDGNCFHCIYGENRVTFLENVKKLLKENGVFFISSLCSKTDEDITTFHENIPYRFIPSVNKIKEEILSYFNIIEYKVKEREEYNHINIFSKHISTFITYI